MITNFKIFETIHVKPKIGDYAIINVYKDGIPTKAIGTIKDIFETTGVYTIEIKYINNITKKDSIFINIFDLKDIDYWSENKEELETILTSEKYNL